MDKTKILKICDTIQKIIDGDKDRITLQFQTSDLIKLFPKNDKNEMLTLAKSMQDDAENEEDDENLIMNIEDALKRIRNLCGGG